MLHSYILINTESAGLSLDLDLGGKAPVGRLVRAEAAGTRGHLGPVLSCWHLVLSHFHWDSHYISQVKEAGKEAVRHVKSL